jgi:hypothetical protein
MAAQDFLLDGDWDLLIENGDLIIGNANQQHIALIVVTGPGHWKENPFLGFNAVFYEGSNANPAEMKANLSEQIRSDNGMLNQLKVSNGFIVSIDADRLIN